MLTNLLLIPFLGALLILIIPGNFRVILRGIAILTSSIQVLKAISIFAAFQTGIAGLQFEENAPWIPAAGFNYHLGVDGLNIGLVLMTSLVSLAAVLVSSDVERQSKLFYLLLLLISGGATGAFLSQDLYFLYFFNELALVPTFIMMGVWGRGEHKAYATYQMAIYLTLGAIVALIGLVTLHGVSGANSLDAATLKLWLAGKPLSSSAQEVVFPLLLFGFGTLVGLWPFHSWAAPGYAAAPTATAMLHAGVLKKVGLYALIRVALPLMPHGAAVWLPILSTLCLGNILYCGWVAMRQRDLALLLGNSSLAHMGFCFLGLASLSVVGITGVVVIMVAHGLLAGLSYAVLGYLSKTVGTTNMDKMGGILKNAPFIGTIGIMAFMAGCGLPGFANFPGEIGVMFGAWKTMPWLVVIAAWGGLIIGGVYMLRAIRDIFHGPLQAQNAGVRDAGGSLEGYWRRVPYLLLVSALIFFGVSPDTLVQRIHPTVEDIVKAATLHEPTGEAKPAPAIAEAKH
jgi:NADH-quinone oxidoreductase subunit M